MAAGGSPGPDRRRLAAVLAALRSPAEPGELAGEPEALAGFAAARRDPTRVVREPRAPARPRRVPVPRLVAPLVAGLAVLAVGVAAQTGTLPAPLQQRAHHVFSGLGVPPAGGTGTTAAASRTPTPVPTPPPSATGRAADPADPQAQGLCQSWRAHQQNPTGKVISAEALATLATLAGGEAAIPAWCAQVLDARPQAQPSGTSTPRPGATPGHPGGGNGHKDERSAPPH